MRILLISLLLACECVQAQLPCNNWLNTPVEPSYVTVGDLDVSGNQITIEANFNRTAGLNAVGGYGFLVSKHTGPGNPNYALWPNGGGITTTTGDYLTYESCPISLNKNYHVALVYDGSTLKFYRDGFLQSQVPATGNLFNNDMLTTIGQNVTIGAPIIFPFIGYINEVRIWNIARTQAQIQAYMNSPLPSPATTPGLIGYYQFNDLTNKQGNAIYDGTIVGSAATNATNTNCTFVADSCPVPISNIVNSYTPVNQYDPCDNELIVEDGSAFKVDDTVLLIQMKGAVIDTSNTASFGTIIDYKNAGNYEINYVKSRTGNVIALKNKLAKQYEIPNGKVQLIRVPHYEDAEITSDLTCLPWDGSKGGVLVINVTNTLTLNANIDVSGKGFKGAVVVNPMNNSFYCHENNYYYPNDPVRASPKGEGITIVGPDKVSGKGQLANGGGGGLEHNSGGGGGSNGNTGGNGGKEWFVCGPPTDNGGLGGSALTYSQAANKIFMGGGGGAGHCDNPPAFNPNGGNGGGIIIIQSNYIQSNGFRIIADGLGAPECTRDGQQYKCHEGMGGGGAGGTILIDANSNLDNLTIGADGGKGADMNGEIQFQLGPGGGGSGGVVWLKAASLPANITVSKNGGANGVNLDFGNDSYGATPGLEGLEVFNLSVPNTMVPFAHVTDSVRIKDTSRICSVFDFTGLAYPNAGSVSEWSWDFGDGAIDINQNTSHIFNLAGPYTVKLNIKDVNGCPDSTTMDITVIKNIPVTATNDTAACKGKQIQLTASGANTYSWSPAAGLDNASISNPIASPAITTKFIVIGTGINGCTGKDSLIFTINPGPAISKSNDTTICKNTTAQFVVSGGQTYQWVPDPSLSNPSVPNPTASPLSSTTYYVTVTDANSCITDDSIKVAIFPDPVFSISGPKNICLAKSTQLSASGGSIYSWSPSASLDNPGISNPVASPANTTIYTVNIIDGNCNASASLTTEITVLPAPDVVAQRSNDLDCSTPASQLTANGAVQYSWTPSESLSDSTIANPVATPLATTLYTVKGTDFNGCINIDTVTVKVTAIGKSGYLMPTAFTPNNDGLNDCYGVKYWGSIFEFDFSVYNRWGERIFHTTNPSQCWNGYYKGLLQPVGVYVFMIKAKTFCDAAVFRKGTFALIR